MNPLDEREQRWTRRAATIGAVAFVVLWAPGFDEFRFIVAAAIGVAMTGLLALAARSGKRFLTGLTALLIGFGPWGFAWVLGAPFLLLSGWLLFRGKARVRTATGSQDDDAGGDSVEDAPAGEDEGSAGGKARRRSGRRARAAAEVPVGPRRPSASKRYTPPSGRPR